MGAINKYTLAFVFVVLFSLFFGSNTTLAIDADSSWFNNSGLNTSFGEKYTNNTPQDYLNSKTPCMRILVDTGNGNHREFCAISTQYYPVSGNQVLMDFSIQTYYLYDSNINASLAIPINIEPGYHTLHITGQNIIGGNIDIQKIVYVAAAVDDFDGDGIKNNNESRMMGELAGIDVDEYGIDDVCNVLIDQAPSSPDENHPNNLGVVTNPIVNNTDKELLPGESRPLDAPITPEEITDPALEPAQNTNGSLLIKPIAQNDISRESSPDGQTTENSSQSTTPKPEISSATEVRGATDKPQDPQPKNNKFHVNIWPMLAVMSTLGIAGYVYYKK